MYDGDASPANSPLQHDQPGDHPTRSANVTAPIIEYPGAGLHGCLNQSGTLTLHGWQ
ncbi:predicted protein [Streptomyces viridosporus ATCC 14672]|uniref:Predicted protein n=1 Tax=Streptomyces viridosporus (strain ATCC 14672 / DSM 40746 / JCM 4963 / KCTC 9882 / NRRL B-12104 / FH 1290) TaxID=566461 RepID=D6A8K2_STRV1|nr:predicted protein [Streptomyces viridosporus ATCC 14672]